jgi:hypothetical protein
LRRVADAKNEDLVVDDFVDRDVGPWRKDQFAGTLYQPGPSDVGEAPQTGDALVNGSRHSPRNGGVILTNVVDDV